MSEAPASIPPLIERYQSAHDRHDIDAALASFADDAVVHDEDETWAGTDRIRQWLTKTSTEYTYTRNFTGNVVDLRYEFTLDGDRISALTIAP